MKLLRRYCDKHKLILGTAVGPNPDQFGGWVCCLYINNKEYAKVTSEDKDMSPDRSPLCNKLVDERLALQAIGKLLDEWPSVGNERVLTPAK
jgi:hypothetical protein